MMKQNPNTIHILLADDDEDDCELFQEVLSGLPVSTFLTTVSDGIKLLNLLHSYPELPPPHLIFLDINMPFLNGIDCLQQIRGNKKFDGIPVFMFSTSYGPNEIDKTYEIGANLYIPKELFFTAKKEVIEQLFSVYWKDYLLKLPKEKFVLKK